MKILLGIRELSILSVLPILILGNTAWAQLNDEGAQPAVSSIARPVDAFDFVLQAAERAAYPQISSRAGQLDEPSHLTVGQKSADALQYRKVFNTTPEQALTFYNSLVQKYGAPKSVRGKDHIWYISRPYSSHDQSDIITIILSMEKHGHVELLMDRARGEDGRASWALPRRKPQADNKALKGSPATKRKQTLLINPD